MSGINANPMWNAILKWSLTQHDGTKKEDIKPMSEEDKAFLTKVFASMNGAPAKKMNEIVEILKMPDDVKSLRKIVEKATKRLQEISFSSSSSSSSHSSSSTSSSPSSSSSSSSSTTSTSSPSKPLEKKINVDTTELEKQAQFLLSSKGSQQIPSTDEELLTMARTKKENSLDELDELVHQIDTAIDLYKIGGLAPLLGCIRSPFPSVRSKAAHVLATTVQNNPKCQEWALEQKALNVLLESLKLSETPSEDDYKVLEKILYAIAGLTRSFQPAQHAFVRLNGISLVVNLIINPENSLRVKKKPCWHYIILLKMIKKFVILFLSSLYRLYRF